jgi:hypothetical protein
MASSDSVNEPLRRRKPMRASELVQQLTLAIHQQGDMPVRFWDGEMDYAFPLEIGTLPERVRMKYPDVTPSIIQRPLDPYLLPGEEQRGD